MKRGQKEMHWVLRSQSGDTDALNSLLNAIQEPIYRYIVGLVNDEHMAYDILQEVFLVVTRKIYWVKDARAFRLWVYRIASREAFRTLRRERRVPEQSHDVRELESAQEVPNALAALTKREMVTEVTQMLNEVSPASRVVLSLHYLHEMTLREVADVLDVSIGTVKSRLSYGLRSLRKKLGQTDSDGDLQR